MSERKETFQFCIIFPLNAWHVAHLLGSGTSHHKQITGGDELDDRCSNLRNVGGRKDVNCFLAEQLNFGAEVFLHGAHADHISLDIFLGLDGAPSCRSFGP